MLSQMQLRRVLGWIQYVYALFDLAWSEQIKHPVQMFNVIYCHRFTYTSYEP